MSIRKVAALGLALVLSLSTVSMVSAAGNVVTASGATSFQPLVQAASEQFMARYVGTSVVVQGGGSGTGLTQVATGVVDIGNSDIFATEKSGIDAKKLTDNRVCVGGFAAVVNPKNPVDNLSQDQLIKIFTGKITNWKDVGGNDEAIVIINRTKGSGTRATFKKWALNNTEEIEAMTEDSSGAVAKIVAETPAAISYLALSYTNTSDAKSKLKMLSFNGVAPTEKNICKGSYPIWSYEHMYTAKKPSVRTTQFINYMFSKPVQGVLIPKLGFIAVKSLTLKARTSHPLL